MHNGNKYGSIPVAQSTKMEEEYDTIAFGHEEAKVSWTWIDNLC